MPKKKKGYLGGTVHQSRRFNPNPAASSGLAPNDSAGIGMSGKSGYDMGSFASSSKVHTASNVGSGMGSTASGGAGHRHGLPTPGSRRGYKKGTSSKDYPCIMNNHQYKRK